MPGSMHTLSPGSSVVTRLPTASTMPDTSWPSTIGASTTKGPIRPWV